MKRPNTSMPAASSCTYEIPLSEIIIDFYDKLKSVIARLRQPRLSVPRISSGRPGQSGSAWSTKIRWTRLAMICHRDDAYHRGQRLVSRLKALIPRQMFTVPVQAAIGKARHFPRQCESPAQRCPSQMLRRRCDAQEKAAGEAEKRQEAHENDRLGRGSAGSLYGAAQP